MNRTELDEVIKSIKPADRQAIIQAKARQAQLAKPPGSLGGLEEMSVRIATLFLIAILSVIYVLGRGSSGASSDTSYEGEGMTGSEIIQDQGVDGRQTEPAQDGDQTDLPTGGGDFQNN